LKVPQWSFFCRAVYHHYCGYSGRLLQLLTKATPFFSYWHEQAHVSILAFNNEY
jgi:hypothetical protein